MSDISALRSQQYYKIQQKNQCQSRINDIDRKLERLKTAKRELTSDKSNAKTKKKDGDSFPDQLTRWEGDKHNTYISNTDQLSGYMDSYYKDVDNALDAVCDAITSLENERSSQYGLLGSLVSAINSIGNEIEKLLN